MENKIIVDGKNTALGRLASYVAKNALLGKEVMVVNSNEVVVRGNKKDILKKYQTLFKKGGSSLKGPKIIRTPERILKRTIRGMLSHKQTRGVDALSRIKCYNKTPEEFKEFEKITVGKEKQGKVVTLKEIASELK